MYKAMLITALSLKSGSRWRLAADRLQAVFFRANLELHLEENVFVQTAIIEPEAIVALGRAKNPVAGDLPAG